MKKIKKYVAGMLSCMLTISMLPQSALATEISNDQTKLNFLLGESKVAFGGREWYVIGDETEGVYSQSGHITLMASNDNNDLDEIAFRNGQKNEAEGYTAYDGFYYANNLDGTSWKTPNEYAGSTLQQKMVSLAEEIPDKELELVTARNLISAGDFASASGDGFVGANADEIVGPNVENQKLWALSAGEYETLMNVMGGSRTEIYNAWLRSPYDDLGQGELIGNYASTDELDVDEEWPAQPVLSLDVSSVLFEFMSANNGSGKTDATVGGKLIGAADVTDLQCEMVKFTVRDSSQNLTVSATTEQSTQKGTELSFSYSDATTGDGQYVSCILRDEEGNVKYYGKLADTSASESGDLQIPLAGVSRGNYTLEIFSEKANDELNTDFCSAPVTMKVEVFGNGTGEVSDFGGKIISDDVYHVWFDGTIGVQALLKNSSDTKTYHPGMSAYYEGAEDTYVAVKDGKVRLPETAGETTKYGYTLNGWYDVYSGTYYGKEMLGQEIEVTQDTVFYADWVASDYSLGNSGRSKVTDQPNTSGFIETNVFDYNELFNIRSTTNDSADSRTYVNADTHAELWRLDESSLGFAFLNWAYNDLTKDRTLGSIANKDTKNSSLYNITTNIISESDGTVTAQGQAILDALFTKSDELGRYYLGTGEGLYQYVSDENDDNYGYYYYDSSKNGASYNQSEQRFVLYSDPEYILEQSLKNNSWQYKTDKATTTGFLPFNDNESGAYNEKDGSINYWFGMQSTVDFWLPNDPGDGGNIADTGKEMEFRFSGDDDVWVFVDDTLVLDLGGIHGARSGRINFSTGKVVTETDKEVYQTTDLTDSIGSGKHKLTIYYLERGSSQSNCSIYFNIAPKYALTILKNDADNASALQGARFGVYLDEACTTPAELYTDANESAAPVNEFVTAADGKATAYGMVAGNTYYVKELAAPDGYHITDGDPICIALDMNGNASVEDGIVFEQNKADKRYYLTLTNERDKGNLTVSKLVAGNAGDTTKDFNFTVKLDDSSINGSYGDMTFENGVASFTLKHNEKKTATGLPAGISYEVSESEADQDGYTTSVTGASGSIVKDETAEAEFTNEKNTGNLTVSKVVAGNAGDATKDFNFTVTLDDSSISGSYGEMTFENGVASFTLKHNEKKTATGLPAGIGYEVSESEADQDGYTTTATGASGSIVTDETAAVAFTNTKKSDEPEPEPEKYTGNLTVSKLVAGNAGDTTKDFNFIVTLDDSSISGSYGDMTFENGVASFTLKHNEEKTATGLPAGISYEVSESEADQDGYTTSVTGASGSIVKDETAAVAFTNTKNSGSDEPEPEPEKKTGNLIVSKLVSGNAGDTTKEFNFTVKLGDDSINGSYGDMTFENGVASFTLKHGEKKTAIGLPAGTSYEVSESEANQNGYTTTAAGAKGSIIKDQTVTAAFTNIKRSSTTVDNGGNTPNKPNITNQSTGTTASAARTGDESNPLFWLILMLAVVAAFAGLCIYGRKGRHKQR